MIERIRNTSVCFLTCLPRCPPHVQADIRWASLGALRPESQWRYLMRKRSKAVERAKRPLAAWRVEPGSCPADRRRRWSPSHTACMGTKPWPSVIVSRRHSTNLWKLESPIWTNQTPSSTWNLGCTWGQLGRVQMYKGMLWWTLPQRIPWLAQRCTFEQQSVLEQKGKGFSWKTSWGHGWMQGQVVPT